MLLVLTTPGTPEVQGFHPSSASGLLEVYPTLRKIRLLVEGPLHSKGKLENRIGSETCPLESSDLFAYLQLDSGRLEVLV